MNTPSKSAASPKAELGRQARSQLALLLARTRETCRRDLENVAALNRDIAARLAANESSGSADDDAPGRSPPLQRRANDLLARIRAEGGFSAALKKSETRLDNLSDHDTPAAPRADLAELRELLTRLSRSLQTSAETRVADAPRSADSRQS